MSSRNSFFILMTIGFVLSVFVTDVMGENLIVFSELQNGDLWYYDKDSIKRSSGKVRVWITLIYGNESRRDLIETFKKHPDTPKNIEDISFNKSLLEIYCKEGEIYDLTDTLYDTIGNEVYTNNLSGEPKFIIPGSINEELKNRVCE